MECESTILYIEDNPANLKLIEQLLMRHRHVRLLTAETAELGLDLAVRENPDLILLDINLPDMDGFSLFQQLQGCDNTRSIPVLAISADAMPNEIQRGLESGFRDYLTKPIDIKKLLAAIDVNLNRKSDRD